MIFRGMTYKTNRAHKSFLFFRPEQYYQLSCLKKVEWSGVKLSMYAITIISISSWACRVYDFWILGAEPIQTFTKQMYEIFLNSRRRI